MHNSHDFVPLSVLKWSGTALTILGAIATALALDPINILCFNFGSLCWLIAAYKMRERSLIVVNAALLAIYFLAVILRLFH